MDELKELVSRSAAGDVEAFALLVRRFQHMACGYAYSVLGDFHLAEDAAQEAFVDAYRLLGDLREPEAFPGWFRRIVFKHCDRMTRRRRPHVFLDAVAEPLAGGASPAEAVERREVREAIGILPEAQRQVVALFYIRRHSQPEIAAFLEVPLTTVKKRLVDARKKLRERMLDMVSETLQDNGPDENPLRTRMRCGGYWDRCYRPYLATPSCAGTTMSPPTSMGWSRSTPAVAASG